MDQLRSSAADDRWHDVARIIDDRFFALLLTSPDDLEQVFDDLPEDWFRMQPRHLMARSILRGVTQPFMIPEPGAYEAFADWVATQASPFARDQLGVIHGRLRARLAAGRFAEADALADQALKTIENATETSGFADVLPMMLLEVGVAKLQIGDIQAALAVFGEAVRWSTARGEHPVLPHARGYIAVAFALLEDHNHASEFLPPEPLNDRAPRGTPLHRMQEAGMLARLLVALGRLDQASVTEILGRVEEDLEYSGLWWIGAHVRATAELFWGDPKTGARSLERTLLARRQFLEGATLAGTVLRADLANLNISIGNLALARHALDAGAEHAADSAVAVSTARLAIAAGQPDEALAGLDRATGLPGLSSGLGILRVVALAAKIGDPGKEAWVPAVTDALERGAWSALADVPERYRRHAFASVPPAAPSIPRPFGDPHRFHRLSEREAQILEALRVHPTVPALASAIFLSPNTVRTHLKSVYRKLGVHSREEALWELAKHSQLAAGSASRLQTANPPDSSAMMDR